MDWILQFDIENILRICEGVLYLLTGGFCDNFTDILGGFSSLNDFLQITSAGGMDQGDIQNWVDNLNKEVTISPLTSEHVLGLSDYLMKYGIQHANKMTDVARALAAVFAVIVAGKEAYKVMAEQRGFDILDILRPILFAFVLAFWSPVVNTVISPGHAVESHCKQLYMKANLQVDSLRKERFNLSKNLGNEIRKHRAAVRQQELQQEKGEMDWIDTMLDKAQQLWDFISSIEMAITATLETAVMHFFETIIIWIGELCYTVAIYIVFTIKALFITTLAMFGPIYMAASVLPAWKDAWRQWVERMVHASLYGAMGYLAMAFSMQLICYSLERDISTLMAVVKDEAILGNYLLGGIGTVCTVAITYFVGCAAMKAVPEMASMVFPGSHSHGAGSFISGMQSTASAPVKMGVNAALKKGG